MFEYLGNLSEPVLPFPSHLCSIHSLSHCTTIRYLPVLVKSEANEGSIERLTVRTQRLLFKTHIMKKLLLTSLAIFGFVLIYGQSQAVKNAIGIEQETVYNAVSSLVNPSPAEFRLSDGRVCRIFLSPRSRSVDPRVVTDVINLMQTAGVELSRIPPGIPLEFYFVNPRKLSYRVSPKFPTVEDYKGLSRHDALVLTHMSDWSLVCKIILPEKIIKNAGYVQNRITYAMGRVVHEMMDPNAYWDHRSNLNDPAKMKIGNSIQEGQRFGQGLNRNAMASGKTFVAELFVYAVWDDLANTLPTHYYYRDRALRFYFQDCRGPICNALRNL